MPLANRFSNLRPLGEFFDFKRLSKPENFGEVQSRASYNLGYFSSNYAVVFVMLSIYSLLTNLLLLFVIILVAGGMWGIGRLGGRDLDIGTYPYLLFFLPALVSVYDISFSLEFLFFLLSLFFSNVLGVDRSRNRNPRSFSC